MQDTCIINKFWQNLGNDTVSYKQDVRDDLRLKNNYWNHFTVTTLVLDILFQNETLAPQVEGELETETNLEGKVFSVYFSSSVLLSETREKIALKLLKSEILCLKGKHYPDLICRTLCLAFSQTVFFPKDKIKNRTITGRTNTLKLIL